jgi:hypothetical protein
MDVNHILIHMHIFMYKNTYLYTQIYLYGYIYTHKELVVKETKMKSTPPHPTSTLMLLWPMYIYTYFEVYIFIYILTYVDTCIYIYISYAFRHIYISISCQGSKDEFDEIPTNYAAVAAAAAQNVLLRREISNLTMSRYCGLRICFISFFSWVYVFTYACRE